MRLRKGRSGIGGYAVAGLIVIGGLCAANTPQGGIGGSLAVVVGVVVAHITGQRRSEAEDREG